MENDLNKEIDRLFEQLELIGLTESDSMGVLANILHCINAELEKMRGVCDEKIDDIVL